MVTMTTAVLRMLSTPVEYKALRISHAQSMAKYNSECIIIPPPPPPPFSYSPAKVYNEARKI